MRSAMMGTKELEFDTREVLDLLFDESLGKVCDEVKSEALGRLRALFCLRPNLWIAHRI